MFLSRKDGNSMIYVININHKISVQYIESTYFIEFDHETHPLVFDCSHGYDDSRLGNNYILNYILIHNMESSILICSLLQNIPVDRLTNKINKTNN